LREGTTIIKVEQLRGGTIVSGVELLRERVGIIEDEHKKLGKVIAKVKQLGRAIATANGEWCFLVMLRLKDLQ
jgi:hypothetical protein